MLYIFAMRLSTLATATALFDLGIAGYVLEDDYMTNFYDHFEFFTGKDPTNGFVKYIDEDTARQSNLINASSTTSVQWGVDVQNKTPNGRPSIRLESKKKYDQGLIVLDVGHMPFGCGTWPAFWTLGPNWPTGGEIDILEGVNDYTNNGMTLHTGPGCMIGSDTTQFSGEVTTPNCDVAAEGQGKNVGCSIRHPSKQSYGAGLNRNGGGVYATQWDSDAISIYFFPRGSIPADVLGDSPNPSAWGKPAAKFAGACDIDKMFSEQKIVIDTTFCGDWAGSEDTWNTGSCAKKAATCNQYVRDNPQAFTEAYWKINALKVYRDNGQASPPPAVSSKAPQSTVVSVPVPVPVPSQSSLIAVPPASTGVVPPAPPKSTLAPSGQAPSPTNSAPAPPPQYPQSSQVPAVSSRPQPSRTIQSQILAPTGKFGMPGWQWPIAGNEVDEIPVPSGPGVSQQNTASGNSSPTTTPNIAQPTLDVAPPVHPTSAAPAAPFIPSPSNVPGLAPGPVQTVYHTVYITVPAEPAATPAPASGAKQARKARHMREHRRRWTQHNARL